MNDGAAAGAVLRATVAAKRRDGRTVLRDVTLDLAAGSLTAILGPSGCGKTTLLHVLGGLDRDYDGVVALAPGTRVTHVFQDPRLLPWRTVGDNIRLVLPRGADPAVADSVLAEVGLPAGIGGAWPRHLSLGMARRAAIARALAVGPDLLLLDEPFASLDEAAAARMRALLARLRADRPRMAAVLVTHDLGEAAALADRVVELGGAPATVLADVRLDRSSPQGEAPTGPDAGSRLREALSAARRGRR